MVEKLLQSEIPADIALGILQLYKQGQFEKLPWRNQNFVNPNHRDITIFFKDYGVWLFSGTMYVSTVICENKGFSKSGIHFDFTDI